MTFSERSALDRRPNPLWRALGARRRRGDPILDLTLSNPSEVGLPDVTSPLRDLFQHQAEFAYAPDALGCISARRALVEHWSTRGVRVQPEQLVVTATTSEAYSMCSRLLAEPGDEVLVPRPAYPLLDHLLRFEGLRLVPYRLAYDGAWHIDWPSVEQARTSSTRALLVVNPSNPTGNFLTPTDIEHWSRLGDLPLVCDEVFGMYAQSGVAGPSALELLAAASGSQQLLIVLDGLSKCCLLPQLKLSWMTLAGDPRLVAEARDRLELLNDAYLSASSVTQSLLPDLLLLGATTRRSVQRRLEQNLKSVRAALDGSAVTLLHSEGGWYAVLQLPAFLDEQAWVISLLESAGVLVQPGYFYDFEQEPLCVVSLLTEESALQRGMARLVESVEEQANARGNP